MVTGRFRRKRLLEDTEEKVTERYIRKGYCKIQKKMVAGRYRRKGLLEDIEEKGYPEDTEENVTGRYRRKSLLEDTEEKVYWKIQKKLNAKCRFCSRWC
jgi:hypothetical protein